MRRISSTLGFVLLAAAVATGQNPAAPAPALPTKPGQMVRLEVLIANLSEPTDSATAADVLELERTGKLSSFIRLQMVALEQQTASVQIGELARRTTGRTIAAGRGFPPLPQVVQNSREMTVGTTLQVTPRIENDGSIAAQLLLERNGIAERSPAKAEEGAAAAPQAVDQLRMEATLHLRADEPQIVSSQQKQNGAVQQANKTWIVISAHVSGATNPPVAK